MPDKRITMSRNYAVGVDIGGSHISSVLIDLESNSLVGESLAEEKVDNKASADEIFGSWAVAIRKSMAFAEPGKLQGVGFAMPGPFDYEKGIALLKNVDKYDSLYGLNVGDELKKRLGLDPGLPFCYVNDAMAFAMGECWLGKASAYSRVTAITLGTGFGSAFLLDGVPLTGGDEVPEMGYVYNIPYGESIADDYFSTRWFVREYARRTGRALSGVKEIAAQTGHESEAVRLFEDYGDRLGNFLAPLLKNFNAGCLLIGGNISGAWPLFRGSLDRALNGQGVHVKVLISELKESAAMAGSARLLDPQFRENAQFLASKI
jgi:glucokinase